MKLLKLLTLSGLVLGTSGLVQASTCKVDQFEQPKAEYLNKLDLIFMVDTSGSIVNERKSIAKQIDAFVQRFPRDFDLQIGVVLAHGKYSKYTGRLYKTKKKGEPVVLRNKDLSLEKLREHLYRKMTRVRHDKFSGGELGLYSLQRMFDQKRFQEAKAQGFFRDQAALGVVFVSDENDICAVYPEGANVKINAHERLSFYKNCGYFDTVKKPLFPIIKSVYGQNSCHKKYGFDKKFNFVQTVTPESVFKTLKNYTGNRPLIVSGILYDNFNFPRRGQNGYAWGYMETIQLAQGTSFNIASANFSQGMKLLADHALEKLALNTEFILSSTKVDASTLGVKVDNQAVNFEYKATQNMVVLNAKDAGRAQSKVQVSYCEQKDVVVVDPPVTPPTAPETDMPEVTNPPVVTDPVVTDPVVTEPVVTQPTEPVVTDPVVTEPVVTEPVVTQPTEPVVTEPVVNEPVVTQPTEPVVTEPVTSEPSNPGFPEIGV